MNDKCLEKFEIEMGKWYGSLSKLLWVFGCSGEMEHINDKYINNN